MQKQQELSCVCKSIQNQKLIIIQELSFYEDEGCCKTFLNPKNITIDEKDNFISFENNGVFYIYSLNLLYGYLAG
jgi:hypothetical protein